MDITQTPTNSVRGKSIGPGNRPKEEGKIIFNVAYRQPANNITADEELANRASERKKRITKIITDINGSSDQNSNFPDPLPRAVNNLSDPRLNAHYHSRLSVSRHQFDSRWTIRLKE